MTTIFDFLSQLAWYDIRVLIFVLLIGVFLLMFILSGFVYAINDKTAADSGISTSPMTKFCPFGSIPLSVFIFIGVDRVCAIFGIPETLWLGIMYILLLFLSWFIFSLSCAFTSMDNEIRKEQEDMKKNFAADKV